MHVQFLNNSLILGDIITWLRNKSGGGIQRVWCTIRLRTQREVFYYQRACIVFYLEIILFNSSNYLLQADGEYVCSTGTRHTDSKHAGRGVFGLCFTRVGSTTLTIDDGESGTFKHLLDLSLNKAYWACKALLSPYHHQRNGMHILYALIQTMRNSIHKF